MFYVPQRRGCVPTRLVCLSNPNKVCAEIPVGDECSSGLSRCDASLVRVIRGQSLNVEDKFNCISLSSDCRRIVVQGLGPGEYELTLKRSGARVSIGVIEGTRVTLGSVGYVSNASKLGVIIHQGISSRHFICQHEQQRQAAHSALQRSIVCAYCYCRVMFCAQSAAFCLEPNIQHTADQ